MPTDETDVTPLPLLRTPTPAEVRDVLDWRRQTGDLYAAVRAAPDPVAAHRVWADGRSRMLLTHPASPVLPPHRAAAAAVEVAPYDPRWRFEVPVGRAEAERLEVTTGTDGVVVLVRVGRVDLGDHVGGLDVWWHAGYGGGLFVPLRHDGPGYGGGRYVLDTAKGADLAEGSRDGTVVLDLNFAYHPSCAYDPAWACPLAPPGNRLDVDVPVGELFTGPWADAH